MGLQTAASNGESTLTTLTLPKLLCVEEDDAILNCVRHLLNRDFTILSAKTAHQAMSCVEGNLDIAVVLADHELPDTKGLELLQKLQFKLPDAVRAIISGHDDIWEMAEAISNTLLHRFILKPWDDDYFRVQMIEALANHSTIRQKHELEEAAITDGVTGLKNHRYFQTRLRIEFENARRHKRNLSLAMIDIDHFKDVNDRHGHLTGDLVLRQAAEKLQQELRAGDTVARYGGDEFAILMPETTCDEAFSIVERIRLTFGRDSFRLVELASLRCTLSIGLASVFAQKFADGSVTRSTQDQQNLCTTSAQDLLALADANLYRAKGQGRNQTVGA